MTFTEKILNGKLYFWCSVRWAHKVLDIYHVVIVFLTDSLPEIFTMVKILFSTLHCFFIFLTNNGSKCSRSLPKRNSQKSKFPQICLNCPSAKKNMTFEKVKFQSSTFDFFEPCSLTHYSPVLLIYTPLK